MATGMALLITMAPDALCHSHRHSVPIRTSELLAQTLMLTAMVAGFRAAPSARPQTRAPHGSLALRETEDAASFAKECGWV